MNLTTKTQKQLAAVEAHGDTCVRSLISFAECLNRAHADFWSKPDNELQEFLQALLDDDNLATLFEDHEYYATMTNSILQRYGVSPVCKTGALKAFSIDDGVVVITQPVVEPELIVEPQVIEEVVNPEPPLPDFSEPEIIAEESSDEIA
jgi:hypothetical protein